ncbi:hypothetical protein K469DRAFT_566641, partial [Zopfia rhizophila CBS 207.26]
DTLNLNAAFSLAVSSFLRMGGFTYKPSDLKNMRRFKAGRLTRRCIISSTAGDHVLLRLPRSKTDHQNAGVNIVVAANAFTTDPAYPVANITTLLREGPQEDDQTLFRLRNGAFSRGQVLKLLAKCLQRCGKDSTHYKGHNFRKGTTQHAYNNHLSQEQIQALGRWTSDAFNMYYNTDPMRLYGLQRRFLTGQPSPLSLNLPINQ